MIQNAVIHWAYSSQKHSELYLCHAWWLTALPIVYSLLSQGDTSPPCDPPRAFVIQTCDISFPPDWLQLPIIPTINFLWFQLWPEEVKREDSSLLGQEIRKTTVSRELKPACIQRAATLCRASANIGERVTGAGIFVMGNAWTLNLQIVVMACYFFSALQESMHGLKTDHKPLDILFALSFLFFPHLSC